MRTHVSITQFIIGKKKKVLNIDIKHFYNLQIVYFVGDFKTRLILKLMRSYIKNTDLLSERK